MINHIAIAGMGWLGQPLASRLQQLHYQVKGSVTSPQNAAVIKSHGFSAFALQITEYGVQGEVTEFLRDVDCLIIMIPPGLRGNTGSDFVLKMTYFLEEIKKAGIPKVILISSTSVYDDSQGMVTEKNEPQPESIAGKQLKQVEELFMATESFKTTVVRFGGLLGGSRQPARFLAGRTNLMDAEAPVNLIHRSDCISILVEIIKQDAFGYVFNAVHPDHPKKSDYYIKKAEELGLEPPTFSKPEADETFKQVDSENLGAILNYSFKKTL